ncbi:MAG TPA: copper resistance CopC family protein [Steroidobacteraceae bacterium]
MKSIILFIGVLLLWPLAALAHAHLQQAVPADGSTVASPPAQFTLKFSEPAHLTALSVQKQGEAHPQRIAPLPTTASAQFSVPAPPLAPGVYELRYRVISADSHVVSGSLHFTVAKP